MSPGKVGKPVTTGRAKFLPYGLRLSPEERATLERAAAKAGQPVREWIISVAMKSARRLLKK